MEHRTTTEQTYPENDPRHHTAKMKRILEETIQHLRGSVIKVSDPKAQALFETSADVLGALVIAMNDYEHRAEPAWK
jgi:hypothetical protein